LPIPLKKFAVSIAAVAKVLKSLLFNADVSIDVALTLKRTPL
jgi:hypothetical protein